MNYRMIINTIGRVLAVETVLLLLPFVTAILYQDSSVSAFLITILITAVASIGALLVKVRNRVIYAKEGFTIVAFAWILVSIFGAIPFYISGAIPSFIDSLFETISGFTTTGASILTEIETLPKGILFWRSFTHWIGGMGVLVFVMAIVPLAGDRSIHVMRAEVPGPTMEKLVPRIKGTAKLLYSIYILLTVVEVIFLVAGKMPVFDSLVHAFGTAGTGGFSIMNASIAAYGSPYLEYVIAIFMMLFGVNFTIFFLLLAREFKLVIKNEELFWYLSIILIATLAITFSIMPQYGGFGEAFRLSFFQVSSIITTTGYATADYCQWPMVTQMILLLLMIVGACAGSTGGGMKVSRLIILLKKVRRDIHKLIHPRMVGAIKMDGKTLQQETVDNVSLYFISYMLLLFVLSLIVSLDGFDFTTTFSSVVACMGNIGPGLGMVGPSGNFSGFSNLSKLTLSLAMLFGRLEIFPLLLAMSPSLYRKK
ncbi:TrkH family potassium uptake protein [Bianquea renquensis]|jgi:hypothetical protein CLOSPO_03643|uniref:TrkH family potassium uptake protein n=1 Tax=Bianquea renquensis TaxID=2763661 RepID=A0A926I1I4_9FIRM|nr:TrkH family potassium uptake protein [Bianquea renquensis]MBC8544279.1 TrkH family potassium uptake protein [Bianquea renquensis]